MHLGKILILDVREAHPPAVDTLPEAFSEVVETCRTIPDFIAALASDRFDIALLRAGRSFLLGPEGQIVCPQILAAARQHHLMFAVIASDLTSDEHDVLIARGFDDVLHEPRHLGQFERQLRSTSRIALMRRELRRRQTTLRDFVAIIEDMNLDLCFVSEESVANPLDTDIVLVDLDPEKSGAAAIYSKLRNVARIQYFEDLAQAQSVIFQGDTALTIINAVGDCRDALSFIASMRFSSSLYNHPVLLVVQSEDKPNSEQVFSAGATDYLEGVVDADDLKTRIQVMLRHERLRQQLAKECETSYETIVRDSLTGLYSFGFAMAHLQHLEKLMNDRAIPVTVAVCRLDNLPRINAEFGYAAGDSVIRQAAAIMRTCVRGEDLVVRYSGRSFLMIFPETELSQASIAMARLNNILKFTMFTLPGACDNVKATSTYEISQWNRTHSLTDMLANLAPRLAYAA